ncbi:MAG TPA: zf-HC2 domain-containing protein [Enhygromyxa sp.]|nr:zf-HC2 domain-containing protein [Enhygromyxa sp.]
MSGSDEHHCTGAGGEGHRHDITCREISEFLLAYLERELDPEARVEFERHLNYCPPCVHYLDGYRETIELVRRCVNNNEPPKDESERAKHRPPEGLIQAILAAKRTSS